MESGVSRWRQISETLIKEIERGVFEADRRLPNSNDLAARFGVNRHTVLRALAQLQTEGIVRMERGRGTYAVVNPLQMRLGPRRWFEQNLIHSNRVPTRKVLSVARLPAPEAAAEALDIAPGSETAFVVLRGEADGVPINIVSNYFPLERFPNIDDVFRAFGPEPTSQLSFGKIFRDYGVADFRRKALRIRSRPPRPEEARQLEIAPVDHVLETDVTLVDSSDTPLNYANTAYASSRVELVVDL
ncbi:phosphonate metabolism transcriptional regulator PhnF [Labrys wisconsinensis]|uniref:GntR family phosphonate transport system transcriptional regulator n=1 Tax=Labrys wisconsinensis TaxID=425677 RepID=A0ABU0J4J6_9HYPH|nr:phosphonate metabolism transcriptional regulator PhnF [Labrys wisconsinensis]MDQ0469195.1 GntR family phosphonate transport system transcriptional regulator [Labrys wisconsinensis]